MKIYNHENKWDTSSTIVNYIIGLTEEREQTVSSTVLGIKGNQYKQFIFCPLDDIPVVIQTSDENITIVTQRKVYKCSKPL